MFSTISALPRHYKRIISVLSDVIFISLAYWGAYFVRLDNKTPIDDIRNWILLFFLIAISILFFIRIGLYRAVLRFVSFVF